MEAQNLALMIPILSILLVFGMVMLGLLLNHGRRVRMFALYHQERMAAIDKGIDLPPLPEAFFAEDHKPRLAHRSLLHGLVWFLVGSALLAALYANEGSEVALYALIPMGLGLAFLVYYFVVGKKEAEALQAAALAKSAESRRPQTP